MSIGSPVKFTDNTKLRGSFQHHVVAPIRELNEFGNATCAAKIKYIRAIISVGLLVIVAFPDALQQHHSDQSVGALGVSDHFAIAGFKNVQRNFDSGKENKVRQRKERDVSRELGHGVQPSS